MSAATKTARSGRGRTSRAPSGTPAARHARVVIVTDEQSEPGVLPSNI